MKLCIPQDISVMGYCGSVDADFISPKLSAVSIGYEETGLPAVKILSESPLWFNVSGNKFPEAVPPPVCSKSEKALCCIEYEKNVLSPFVSGLSTLCFTVYRYFFFFVSGTSVNSTWSIHTLPLHPARVKWI